ncbi:hypothetical protein CPB85DRAFT_176727 [Mucidula mucida]|nr:hypothetical protein CPB85DRAFT_176727 [Mucidula mucida]
MAKSKGKAKASRRTGLNLSAAQLARRQEIKTLAMAIVTTKNSPVNRDIAKLALHQKVADDIVLLPPKHWMNLIAVKTNRAPAQVDNWFRNRQQRIDPEKASDIFGYTDHTLPSGEMAKMARAALSRAQTRNFSWTDEQFERVLDEWWSNISDFYPELRERGRTIPHYSSRV